MNYRNRKTGTLLALLAAGCMIFSGCGNTEKPASAQPANEQEEGLQTAEDPSSKETALGEQSGDIMGAADSADSGIHPDTSQSAVSQTAGAADTGLEDASGEPVTGEIHSIVGIITDATTYSLAVQVPEGETYYLTIPDSGLTGNLNYITIGQIATITYRGSLDENHAALAGISDSSLVTGIYVEEYAFAIKIINAYRSMDMKALSDLTNFPVFLETGDFSSDIGTSGEFEAIAIEKIFTEALMERLANYNLFDLEYTDAGFVMGKGTPSITFDVDDDGILGIIGINCNPAPDTAGNK